MLRFLLRRLATLLPLVLLIVLISFLLLKLIPGDQAVMMLGIDATPERVASMRQRLGLDRPLHEQFAFYLAGVAEGDLGRSGFLDQPVLDAVLERAPVSLMLAGLGLFWAVLLGIPAGVVAATHRGRWQDQLLMTGSLLGMSIPSFWLGLALLMMLGVWVEWLPTGGYVSPLEDVWQAFRHLLLPSLSLGLVMMAQIARMTRSAMLEVLRQDYVMVARAKGLSEARVLFRHALKNGLVGILTVIAMIFAEMLGGALVTEQIFSLPGLGQLILQAVGFRDYPTIQGTLLLVGIAYVAINLATDLAYGAIDPRVRER